MGKKPIPHQNFSDISEETKHTMKLCWVIGIKSNSEIMRDFDIAFYNFYRLVKIWETQIRKIA
jgi:hypothetical protein